MGMPADTLACRVILDIYRRGFTISRASCARWTEAAYAGAHARRLQLELTFIG